MIEAADTLKAAQYLAVDLGWPVLPVKPHGKEPLTPHGVKDATVDERTILHWWAKWPDANLGVATGAPGPQVLDVDDLTKARFILTTLENAATPESATDRGRHLFYAGQERGTITLGYGELRGRGSYVICPPSIHPSGKAYVWLNEPTRRLPDVPNTVVGERQHTAGAGVLKPRDRVPHGERHDHLKDIAVRLVRAGVLDPRSIELALRAEYEARCEHTPAPRPDEFSKLAAWAVKTDIAGRESERADDARAAVVNTGMPPAPSVDAPMAEHRAYVAAAAGLPSRLAIVSVKRFGGRLVDPLLITLTGNEAIYFVRQGDITVRGVWGKTVTGGTDGAARPRQLKDWELVNVYSSLCILAGAQAQARTEAEELSELLDDLLGLCEPLAASAENTATTFTLIERVRAREPWDPYDRSTKGRPVLVLAGTERYLRAGELNDYLRFRGAGVVPTQIAGRMAMLGLERVRLSGREREALVPGERRRTNTALFYRLPPGADDDEGVSG